MHSKLFVTVGPPPLWLFNSSGIQGFVTRHWTRSPGQVSFLLSCIGHLPPLRLQEEAKSLLEKSLFILAGAESDTTDTLRADITYVYLGDHPCTATKLNGFVIIFLSTSLCLFFYDANTEKPNPLNNSYFDLQKTTNISSGQGKHVSSCVRVQEHWVSPFRSFQVHQVKGWSNWLSR